MSWSEGGRPSSHPTAHAVFGAQSWAAAAKKSVVVASPRNLCLPHDIPGFQSAKGPASGAVLLVERGGCSFATKAHNAQILGAAFVLIYNSAGGADMVSVDAKMQCGVPDRCSEITIPVLFAQVRPRRFPHRLPNV